MICDTIIVFDHVFQTIKVVSHVYLPSATPSTQDVKLAYDDASEKIGMTCSKLLDESRISLPEQGPIPPPESRTMAVSNVGKVGYESFVTELKQHIVKGNIIQAVPSQQIRKTTKLHPFNAYRYVPIILYTHT